MISNDNGQQNASGTAPRARGEARLSSSSCARKSESVFSAGALAKVSKYFQRQRRFLRMQAKLFLTLMQIVGSIKQTLGSKFPPVFSKLLVVFDIVNFDFLPSLNLACTMQFGA